MFRYAMKAAVNSRAQLSDRIAKFKAVALQPAVELFIPGFSAVTENSDESAGSCSRFPECRYIVHFPLYDAKDGYIFDPFNEEDGRIETMLDFCVKIGSDSLILHRCYGFGRDIDKERAEEKFLEKLVRWHKLSGKRNIKLLIENYGFAWLPKALKREYVSSAIDHFFPWDIVKFQADIKKIGLGGVGVILDIAHAVLSSNMFNMRKFYPELKTDKRFANIYEDDLEKKDILRPGDYIFDFIGHFHISDSYIWQRKDGIGDMRKFLCTENLPIGRGNINYKEMFKDVKGKKTMVMEIDPENGDYENNISQLEAIEYFSSVYDKQKG